MKKDFELKILNIRKSLIHGDLGKIALKAGVSMSSVQSMFKVKNFKELKPTMKLALNAAIDFIRERKISDDMEVEKIMEL